MCRENILELPIKSNKMKTAEYEKTKEFISKFPNGEQLYRESALFNRIIQSMVRGVSEIEIIEQLIRITEDSIKAQVYMIRKGAQFLQEQQRNNQYNDDDNRGILSNDS